MKQTYIGSFELGNQVDITDPCYDKDTWCRMTTECQPGTYAGYVEISDEGEWGQRVSTIAIYKDGYYVSLEDMERIGNIGVDAGLAGFFNNKPDYPDDEWTKFLTENGVIGKEHDSNKDYYLVDYGVFSGSGYGDGGYDVYANKERTAFQIVFIDDEDDDYEEEDED